MRKKSLFNLNLVVMPICLVLFFPSLTEAGPKRPVAPPPLSKEQRASMQVRVIESDYEVVYASVLSLLQDDGWAIEEVDKDSGIVQASSTKVPGLIGPRSDWKLALPTQKERKRAMTNLERRNRRLGSWTRWLGLTARVEPWNTGNTRVRITIVKKGSLPTMNRNKGGFFKPNRTYSVPGSEQDAVLEDASVYELLFSELGGSIFHRETLTTPVPKKSAPEKKSAED